MAGALTPRSAFSPDPSHDISIVDASSEASSLCCPIFALFEMGFYNSCWEALLQLTSYTQVLDSGHQQPLHLPHSHDVDQSLIPPSGVSFQVEGTGFTCHYPTMRGYRSCNSRNDRSCWLEGPSRRGVRYDINTPCMSAYGKPRTWSDMFL